ncbi:hypothetical protein ACFQ46_05520 [Kineococcus sp. GCM10028916]|uniref:hypothetical protein n=1 Tax=Kineococcus sp. GCM10028916 TaxID=3273394 RepID=UPI003632090F
MTTPRKARWSEWVLIAVFAVQTAISVADREWGRALAPGIFLVGFAGQLLLHRLKRPTAATTVLFVAIVAVFVVSIVRHTWWLAGVLGVGLLALAGIWGTTWWVGRRATQA